MERVLPDWIESYFKFVEETESPLIYHRWVAMSVIASVLRKKIWLKFGRIKIYPNMYVVFVAPPAVTRKTQAISFGAKLLREVPDVVTSADSVTREALIDDLQRAEIKTQLPTGEEFAHCSLSVISREFESFLGDKKENRRMLVFLTDLFDCEDLPWKYRTKNMGSNVLPAVFFNLIGATTPESLATSLPSSATGLGLTSRTMFITAKHKRRKVDIPEEGPYREELIRDLNIIARMAGEFEFSKDGREWWRDFYKKYDEEDPKRLCTDRAFGGWYGRKPLYIHKVAMILSASRSEKLTIGAEEQQEALRIIEEAELTMSNAFSFIGRSEVSTDVELVMGVIRDHSTISEQDLMKIIWKDVDKNKFDNVIETARSQGKVKRLFEINGAKGIWYKWMGE